jgi:tetratricopeptide (TPR) repeat protein
MKKKAAAKRSAKKTTKTTTPPLPPGTEDLLREFVSAVEGDGVSIGDMQALFASLTSASADDAFSDEVNDAQFEAQELAFAAMEARSKAEARKLARRALKRDPDCVDALVLLADLDAPTMTAHIAELRAAVAAGERSLGQKFMLANEGRFWLMLDTRPYMRALETLGRTLAEAGLSRDAIAVYEKMLAHNPNDNQGIRDPLLGLYLQVDDLDGASRLLKRYKSERSAAHLWGKLLERLLAADYAGAEKTLVLALKANRFVAVQLTEKLTEREPLPEMYSLGSVEEAILCKSWLGMAWRVHPEAREWVVQRLKDQKPEAAVSRTKKTTNPKVQ